MHHGRRLTGGRDGHAMHMVARSEALAAPEDRPPYRRPAEGLAAAFAEISGPGVVVSLGSDARDGDWLLCAAVASPVLWAMELKKLLVRRR